MCLVATVGGAALVVGVAVYIAITSSSGPMVDRMLISIWLVSAIVAMTVYTRTSKTVPWG
jgi:hypothetical protein